MIAGGSGFLRQSLARKLLAQKYEVVVLGRGEEKVENNIRYVRWDGRTLGDWVKEINGSAIIVNFTGRSVNCVYTKSNREEIFNSRLDLVRVLKEAVLSCEDPPGLFIQSGSLAIFGDTKEECHEEAPLGSGFSADVCKKWEDSFFTNPLPNTRKVVLRIGFVLGKDGGALDPLMKLTRYGLGGTVGSGDQYISWIHIDDFNAMVIDAIERSLEGVYNATGPSPVTNRVFMQTLRKVMGKGWAPPAPTPLVKLGAYLVMRADPGLALTGRRCIPRRYQGLEFEFEYTDLEKALRNICCQEVCC